MRVIKFVQWMSSIAIALIILWTVGFATWAIVTKADPTMVIGAIVKVDTVLAIFVAPEKAAAFFGPVLKRKQLRGKANGKE